MKLDTFPRPKMPGSGPGRPRVESRDKLTQCDRWLVIIAGDPGVWYLVDEWEAAEKGSSSSGIAQFLRRKGFEVVSRTDWIGTAKMHRAYARWPHGPIVSAS